MAHTAFFKRPGNSITITAGSDIERDSVVVQGTLVGISVDGAKSGNSTELQISGVHDFPALSSQNITAGAAVFWDTSAENMTTTSTNNTAAGVAVTDSPSGEGRVQVLLNGSPA